MGVFAEQVQKHVELDCHNVNEDGKEISKLADHLCEVERYEWDNL